MKRIIALLSVVMALAISLSVIAIAEQTTTEAADTAVVVEETVVEETVAAEEAVVEEAVATAAPEATEPPHVHEWSANGRECIGCGEAYICWNDEEKTFVHDFTDSEFCLVCEAALYCGVEGHEKTAKHAMGECGVPGHFVCDELDHDRVYGKGFDYEGHTACLEEVEHECEDCGRTYTCEFSNSHVRCIKCEKMWCNKTEGDHTETACGHRHCEIKGNYKKHAKCEGCGKYICKGGKHDNCVVVSAPTTAPTEAPTTEVPTTEVPTTEAPTTEAPTTEVPTTEAPTTEVPTTVVPE